MRRLQGADLVVGLLNYSCPCRCWTRGRFEFELKGITVDLQRSGERCVLCRNLVLPVGFDAAASERDCAGGSGVGLLCCLQFVNRQVPEGGGSFVGVKADAIVAIKGEYSV